MRRTARVVSALLLVGFAAAGRTAALRPEGEAEAVIDKAVKAMYPKGLTGKNKGLRTKSKGTLHVMGLNLEYTQEVAVQLPKKFKEVMELNANGTPITVTSVYNGKDAWIKTGDKNIPITKEILNEFEEAAYTVGLVQGMFAKDKAVKYALVGEVKVKGKPAIGVTVSKEGKKDINLFFDKETGLMVKMEMRKLDIMSNQEVTEERFMTEYQDVGGRKVPKKIEVVRDGKPLLEAEVTEVKILETVDDSEFVQPK